VLTVPVLVVCTQQRTPVAKYDHNNIFDIQKCLNERLEGREVPLVLHIQVSEPLLQCNALRLTVRANADK